MIRIPPRKVRAVQRSFHFVASAILLVYLYTPLGANAVYSFMVRAMVVPMLAVTGILMWQMPRIRKVLKKYPNSMAPVGARGEDAA